MWHRKKRTKKKIKAPRKGAYNSRGRVNENLVDDRFGPVVFWEGDEPVF